MNLLLWWHMHQPDYRDVNGKFMLPWVYLHALKDYIDMPLHIMANPGMKANINITPVLLEQWRDYNYYIGKALNEESVAKALQYVPDPFLRPLLMEELDSGTREWMAVHYKWINYDTMVSRFPEYKRMFDIFSNRFALSYLKDDFYFDLCVWFHLAWCGEWIKRCDPVINYFIRKGHNFTADDRKLLLKRLSVWLRYGVTLYGFSPVKDGERPDWPPKFPDFIEKKTLDELKGLKHTGSYSITLSPGYHPIIPLLLDLQAGAISAQMSGAYYEPINIPGYAGGGESAENHMDMTDKYFNEASFYNKKDKNKNLWPSEGAISSESLNFFDLYNINFCASGEEILSVSMGMDVHKPVFINGRETIPLYNLYRWKDTGLKVIFRDSGLSDLIGFTYSKWRGDDAAHDLVNRLLEIDKRDKNALVSIILDGENAWEYFYENGFYFLNDLYSLISSSVNINSLFVEDVNKLAENANCIKLDYVYPGSWVNGNLGMWIGEKEKNTAWALLCQTKIDFMEWKSTKKRNSKEKIDLIEKQLMAAEGSDWFWWLGKDSPAFSQITLEKVFRNFLKEIYLLMGKPVPAEINKSLASTEKKFAEVGGMMHRGHS